MLSLFLVARDGAAQRADMVVPLRPQGRNLDFRAVADPKQEGGGCHKVHDAPLGARGQHRPGRDTTGLSGTPQAYQGDHRSARGTTGPVRGTTGPVRGTTGLPGAVVSIMVLHHWA